MADTEASAQQVVASEAEAPQEQLQVSLVWGLTLNIPGFDSIKFNLQPTDVVQDIRQWVFDLPETSFLTCFSIAFNGTKLSDFVELRSVPGLGDGATLQLANEKYNEKAVYMHVRRLHEILSAARQDVQAKTVSPGIENLSPSFLYGVADTKDDSPLPDDSSSTQPASLSKLYEPLTKTGESIRCIKDIGYSGWNPPTGNRQLQGDVAYLRIVTLENEVLHVTASTNGFYINRSADDSFDPKERANRPCNSHHLVGLLDRASPLFRQGFAKIKKSLTTQSTLLHMSSPQRVVPWCAPTYTNSGSSSSSSASSSGSSTYVWDSLRSLDSLNAWSENDFSSPGQARDWNDELQVLKDLPTSTYLERVFKDRTLYKFHCDFAAAVKRGAMAIVHDNLVSFNPFDPKESQMFQWNNIFFSISLDGREIFKDLGGDNAAHSSAGSDIRGVTQISNLDIPGLYTLGTAVVDYAGWRIVGQTIVPGVLKRNQESNSVICGSVDGGKTIASDPKLEGLLEQVAKALHIKPHKLKDQAGNVHTLNASYECKGILGWDSRHYVLDLFRITPPDANFVETQSGEFPSRHSLYVLRPELVHLYYEAKLIEFLSEKVKAKREEEEAKKKASSGSADAPADGAAATATDAESGENPAAEAEPTLDLSLPEYQLHMDFNPDVFTPVALGGTDEENEKDKEDVRKLARFITEVALPKFAYDLQHGTSVPMDSISLRDAMHSRGLNMRYLGALLELVQKMTPQPAHHIVNLLLSDMIVRAAKHLFRKLIRQVSREQHAEAVSCFLNLFLGSSSTGGSHAGGSSSSSKGGKKKGGKTKTTVFGLTSASFWEHIVEIVGSHFRYKISANVLRELALPRLPLLRSFCQKTGVQIAARDYDFHSREVPTFTVDDVLNLVPVVKQVRPRANDAHTLYERATTLVSRGNFPQAIECFEEALSLMHQTQGPLNELVASCYRHLAWINAQFEEFKTAVEYQEKAVLISERALGVDHMDTIRNYINLGSYVAAAGNPRAGMAYLHHARRLVQLVHGSEHTDIASIDNTMAVVLIQNSKIDEAMSCFERSASLFNILFGKKSLEVFSNLRVMSRSCASVGRFRLAIAHEKTIYQGYKELFGEEDPRTKDSITRIEMMTRDSIALDSRIKAIHDLKAAQESTEKLKAQKDKAEKEAADAAKNSSAGAAATAPPASTSSKEDTRSIDELLGYISGKPQAEKKKAATGGAKSGKSKNQKKA